MEEWGFIDERELQGWKGGGAWLHQASGGGGVFAIKQDVEPGEPAFVFLATSSVGGRVFERLDEAVAWLDGVSHGQGK